MAADAPACPACGATLRKRHCKFVCPNHGPVIDCSDPFR
ncbi:MAG: HVO_2523 family zinc finger protein [Halobacteriales archaeon]